MQHCCAYIVDLNRLVRAELYTGAVDRTEKHMLPLRKVGSLYLNANQTIAIHEINNWHYRSTWL